MVMTHQDELVRFRGFSPLGAPDNTCPNGCDHNGAPEFGLPSGSGCPNRWILAPAFQAALRLHNLKTVAPLADWPTGYSAWAQDAMMAIENGIGEKRLRDMENR